MEKSDVPVKQGRQNEFESDGGAWNTKKYCRPPCLADKKNFRILDALWKIPSTIFWKNLCSLYRLQNKTCKKKRFPVLRQKSVQILP